MEIPVLLYIRNVGTQKESGAREWKDRDKRRSWWIGKSAYQSEDVMWTEIKVGKHMSHVPRKAAIELYIPVP